MTLRALLLAAGAAVALSACQPAEDTSGEPGQAGEGGVVNLYTARHYDSDRAVYAAFQEDTGIEVRVIEISGPELLERLRAEGEASPADVVIIADGGLMGRVAEAGLLQPLESEVVESRIPANLQDPENRWFAFSRRARVVAYDTTAVRPEEVDTYEELAGPRFRGQICVRSSDNPYNLSLLAALIERWGPERAEAWARGIVANMARPPEGGDRDQIRAVAAGQCQVAITNSYYFLGLAESEDAADRAVTERVALGWPSLDGRGAHINVSGAGLAANAPNRDNAVRFLEYLIEARAQAVFPELTNEFAVVEGTPLPDDVAALSDRPVDPLAVSTYGPRQAEAQRIFEAVGWR